MATIVAFFRAHELFCEERGPHCSCDWRNYCATAHFDPDPESLSGSILRAREAALRVVREGMAQESADGV